MISQSPQIKYAITPSKALRSKVHPQPQLQNQILLFIEDGAAVGGYVYLSSASNEAIVNANSALCTSAFGATTNFSSQVSGMMEGVGNSSGYMGCVMALPEGGARLQI